jgi:hypothetical protein
MTSRRSLRRSIRRDPRNRDVFFAPRRSKRFDFQTARRFTSKLPTRRRSSAARDPNEGDDNDRERQHDRAPERAARDASDRRARAGRRGTVAKCTERDRRRTRSRKHDRAEQPEPDQDKKQAQDPHNTPREKHQNPDRFTFSTTYRENAARKHPKTAARGGVIPRPTARRSLLGHPGAILGHCRHPRNPSLQKCHFCPPATC